MEPYPWMALAFSKMGEEEVPGPAANPFVLECLSSTTLDGPDTETDETPWCSAFVNWCLEQTGIQGTDSAWARSWLNWGKEVDYDAVRVGSIVVLKRGDRKSTRLNSSHG